MRSISRNKKNLTSVEIKDGMSRNYKFREKVKKKEQNKMALSCEVMGCQPSVPRMRKNKKVRLTMYKEILEPIRDF